MRNAILGGLAGLVLSCSSSSAGLIHDVAISPDYSGAVNSVRIDGPTGILLDKTPTIDKTLGDYTIKFKIKNLGGFQETVAPKGTIYDSLNNPIYTWNHSNTSLNIGESKYRQKTIDFSTYQNGNYTVELFLPLEGDNYQNNAARRGFSLIPEPTSIVPLALGSLAFLKRKKDSSK